MFNMIISVSLLILAIIGFKMGIDLKNSVPPELEILAQFIWVTITASLALLGAFIIAAGSLRG